MRLECHNLYFSYPGTDITILEKMSCAFSRPGFHSVFGPSGVGKSSFAKLIARANSPTQEDYQGSIVLDGIEKILYSYNLERLPGWESTGKHLEKIVAPAKHALKENLIDIFEIRPLPGVTLQQTLHGPTEQGQPHPLPSPGFRPSYPR
ncbi:P-loop NTPase family protein [Desulfotalea psychrophila]|uniref:hypothetical protein n=1 Tax=Desulfotalea psychrophila TaxID=84980 RepID=UPI001D171858|nr:hypothetical protein [Desulfotalea psychrophila]